MAVSRPLLRTPVQHPDKNKAADATPTFQALGLVHAVLSDPEKRKVYDDTGVIDDESEEGRVWCVLLRRLQVQMLM